MITDQSAMAACAGYRVCKVRRTTRLRKLATAALAVFALAPIASAQLPNRQYDMFYPSDMSLADQVSGYYGYTMVDGDFNCDGRDDLATGSPYYNTSGQTDSGLVMFQYATATGLFEGTSEWLHQNIGAIPGIPEPGDHFGGSVTSGDFNGDGCDDVAIGIPYEDLGTTEDAGAVVVVYGSVLGIDDATAVMFQQGSNGLPGTASADDYFGFSVAAGDFNGDGLDDLAISAPWNDIPGAMDSGAVQVLFGGTQGITATGQHYFYPGTNGLPAANPGERFGWALAFADVDPSYFGQELVIGHPYRDVNGANGAGMVSVMIGGSFNVPASESFSQDTPGISGALEANDHFGLSLATGDFDGDGYDDVAAGVPGEDLELTGGTMEDVGSIIVMSLGPDVVTSDLWLRSDLDSLDESDYVNDEFGRTLLGGDFNDDGLEDLAVGTPSSDSGGMADEGAQFILYGKAGALLSDDHAQRLRHCIPGCSPNNQQGRALASGQFDGFPGSDLAVSHAGMDQGAMQLVGVVKLHYADNLFRGPFEPMYRELVGESLLYNLAGVQGQDRYYRIFVPFGMASFHVETADGTGDVDLYVRFGSLPGLESGTYDCRGFSGYNDENCEFGGPQAGYWYIRLRGFLGYSDVRLFADSVPPVIGP